MCQKCGSLLATVQQPVVLGGTNLKLMQMGQAVVNSEDRSVSCKNCDSTKHIHRVPVPYVWKLLVSELAAMNIKVTMDIRSIRGR